MRKLAEGGGCGGLHGGERVQGRGGQRVYFLQSLRGGAWGGRTLTKILQYNDSSTLRAVHGQGGRQERQHPHGNPAV